jgi:acylglycerol lipase
MDHYGHGKSDGRKADIPRFEYYADDLLKLVRQEAGEKEARALPVILLGHSMGGAVTAALACRCPEEVDALIFSGAAIRNESGASALLRTIAMILGTIAPSVPVKPFDAEGISKDPEVVRAYKEDPLVYTGSMKARMGRELLRVTSLTTEALLAQIRKPTLILHGGADRLVDPRCSSLLHTTIGSERKQLHIFEGLFHEIFNEPEQEMVLDTTEAWLKELF